MQENNKNGHHLTVSKEHNQRYRGYRVDIRLKFGLCNSN